MVRLLAILFVFFSVSSAVFCEDLPFKESSSEEFEKAFGDKKGITEIDQSDAEKDKLHIGGSLQTEFQQYENEDFDNSRLANPYTLSLYFDSRLRHDIRAYSKSKIVYDPTIEEEEASQIPGLSSRQTQGDLEELKIMFNIKKRAFMTVGKQKIKWGSAKFWNPTDIINTTKRDFLKTDDERSGLPLVKMHVPIESSNFYVMGLFDRASKSNQVGYAGRFEVPIKTSEISLSAMGRKGRHTLYATDFSAGVWDLDFYGEAAFSKGSDTTRYRALDTWPVPPVQIPQESDVDKISRKAKQPPCTPDVESLPCEISYENAKTVSKVTGGVSYEYKYSDQDTLTLYFEYFHNEEGYKEKKDYSVLMQNGAYQPFYLGLHYGMVSFYLPAPGSWNDWTFVLFNVANYTDHSYLAKLDATLIAMQDLTTTFGVSHHYGNREGEFLFTGQKWDFSLALKTVF